MKKRFFLLLLSILTVSICLFVGCNSRDTTDDKTPDGDGTSEGGSNNGSGNGGSTDEGSNDSTNVTPTEPSKGLEFILSDDETYYILVDKGTCTDSHIIIPSVHNDKPVKQIINLTGNATTITIPSSITHIYEFSFDSCKQLTTIIAEEENTVYKSVDGILYSKDGKTLIRYPIGKTATEFTVPGTVETIGNNAFYSCNALTNVIIPNSVKTIGDNAFDGCTGFTSISLPNSIKTLGTAAFANCSELTDAIIPNSVDSVGHSLFYHCDKLETLTLPFVGEKRDGSGRSYFGCLFSASEYNSNYSVPYTLHSVVITGGTKIADEAFKSCSSLKSITLSNTIESIGVSAFAYCYALTHLNIPSNLKTIDSMAFNSCYNLISLTIPSSVTSIGEGIFTDCFKLIEIICDPALGITTTSHGLNAFYVHSGETVIVNKNGYLFCTDGEKNYLLSYTGSDASLTLPSDFNGESYEIFKYAFYERNSLTSVTIPNNVTAIGDYAFYSMPMLKTVTLGNDIKTIGKFAFCSSYSIETLTIPSSVTTIEEKAFNSCSGLQSIIIPDSVTYLGEAAFYFCDGLVSVTIGNGIEVIEKNTFTYCRSLKTVTFGSNVTTLGEAAFSSCSALTNIVLAGNLTTLGKNAFSQCTALEEVTLGNNMKNIGERAFYMCTKLTTIIYCGTETEWNSVNKNINWDEYYENGSNLKLSYTLTFSPGE